MTKKKKKSSKKRKHNQDDDDDDIKPNSPEPDGKKELTRTDDDDDLLKAVKPTTKKPRLNADSVVSPEVASVEKSQKKAKKKKKKKKKSKNKSKSETEAVETDSIQHGDDTDATPLEGCMVDDQMVLVDRVKGKVYSMTDRQDNGDNVQIGTVGKDGKITLSNKQEKESKAPVPVVVEASNGEPEFPFETDPDDHCESPLNAYQDVVPFLNSFKGKNASNLKIYDPYYCNGGVAQHLKSLGFPNVYNQKEDCYQVWADPSRYPSYDMLVTNPPYSGDHIEKLIQHITSRSFGDRPWMLLLPQWVHKKDYYLKLTQHIRPFYMVPHKRYIYVPPPSFREAKKSDVHKKSSPFVSMWFIWGGTMQQNDQWISRVARGIKTCDIARSKSALRDLRRKGTKKK